MFSKVFLPILAEFNGKRCKVKLVGGEILTGILAKNKQVNSSPQTVQLIENATYEAVTVKTILISQIYALALA